MKYAKDVFIISNCKSGVLLDVFLLFSSIIVDAWCTQLMVGSVQLFCAGKIVTSISDFPGAVLLCLSLPAPEKKERVSKMEHQRVMQPDLQAFSDLR